MKNVGKNRDCRANNVYFEGLLSGTSFVAKDTKFFANTKAGFNAFLARRGKNHTKHNPTEEVLFRKIDLESVKNKWMNKRFILSILSSC